MRFFYERVNESILRQAPKSWSGKIEWSSPRSRRADRGTWPPNCLGLNPDSASYQLCDLECPDQNFVFQSPASMSVFCPDMGAGSGEEAVPPPAPWRAKDKDQGSLLPQSDALGQQSHDRPNKWKHFPLITTRPVDLYHLIENSFIFYTLEYKITFGQDLSHFTCWVIFSLGSYYNHLSGCAN